MPFLVTAHIQSLESQKLECSEYSLAVLHLFSIDRAALKNVSGMISHLHWEIVKNIAVALVGKYVQTLILDPSQLWILFAMLP